MRSAVFGGSFNPPHVAHQMVCLYVLETQRVDRVLWVPVNEHPFAKDLAPFAHRYEMCCLAALPFGERALVSRVEEGLPTPSRTLITLKHLRASSPDEEFCLIIGSDIVPDLPKWYGWDEIRRLCDVIVVPRQGHGAVKGEVAMPAISSTEIRARLARGEDVGSRVPQQVLAYIRQHGLYGTPKGSHGA